MPSISQVITALTYLPQIGQAQATFDANVNGHIGTELPQLISQINTWAGQANTLASSLNAVASGAAMAISYKFSTTTADADPGAGYLRLGSATQNTSTVIRADVADQAGNDWTAALDIMDGSTSAVKGFVQLTKQGDASKFILFALTARAAPTGYRNLTVSPVAWSTANPFANGDDIVLEFIRNGDKGDQGVAGTPGTLGGTATSTIKLLNATAVASAATVNLDSTTDGNLRHITGTTTITAVTLTRGPMWVVFDGALTLTHHATNNNLPGAANITTAAGDRALYWNDGTTTYCLGYWKADGTAVVGSNPAFGALGTANVVQSVNTGGGPMSICSLSATRQMVFYQNASSQPTVAIVDGSGAMQVAGTTVEAVTTQSTTWQIVPLTSTTALCIYSNSTTSVRAAVVTDAGASITIGTQVTVESVNSTTQCLIPFSATKVGAIYGNVTGTNTRGAVLGISGTTITVNTPSTVGGSLYDGDLRADAISSTQGVIVGTLSSATNADALVVTESSNSMTGNTAKTLGTVRTTVGGVSTDVCAVSATRVAVLSVSNQGIGNIGFQDVSGTGAGAVLQGGRTFPLAGVATARRARLKKLSSKSLLLQICEPSTVSTALALSHITISGDGVCIGNAAVNVARSGNLLHDFCIPAGGTSVVSAYLDQNNSNFPTARSVPLGSVT